MENRYNMRNISNKLSNVVLWFSIVCGMKYSG